MSKLYPPEIGGTIPAFYDDGTDVVKLSVPFIMNKTVSEVDVSGFALIIRTVANSKLIATLRVDTPTNWDFKKNEVYFKLYKNVSYDAAVLEKLHTGSHYKLQLAYVGSDNVIGYYSSVGVIKYTTKPVVAIDGLETAGPNMNLNTYIGTYSQDGSDMTEKVYSYIFNIYDKSNNLYITSGERLHNSFEDSNRHSSRDTFTLTKDLIDNQIYYIEYIVKTINNARFSSGRYKIINKTTVNPDLKATLTATLNYDNGYIDVRLVGDKDENGVEPQATGQFVLKRGSDKDNYTEWNTILTFRLNGTKPSRWLYRDFTIEHGYNYKYALQQINSYNMYSNKIYSNEIKGVFEDMFLYDGEKQLKMRFNPKITSFKNTILETKTNTIGNKYPFTFRNKSVYYKEFPINGLLSYFMNEEELFVSNKEILLKDLTTDLIDDNLTSERLFKLKVLEFFNDGKPKLFRSPTEGNYLIKLMNVSMTPTDQLGRLLHSITGTAYEIADFNYENLTNLNFITLDNFEDDMITRWETIALKNFSMNENLLSYAPAYDLLFENVVPGTIMKIIYDDNSTTSIAIGVTGQYQLKSKQPIKSVSIVSGGITSGSLMYSYKTNTINTFDSIRGVELEDYPMIQLYGTVDLLNHIQDVRTELISIHYMRFIKRYIQDIYYKEVEENGIKVGKYFWNIGCTSEVPNVAYNSQYIYQVLEPSLGLNDIIEPKVLGYLDGSPNKKLKRKPLKKDDVIHSSWITENEVKQVEEYSNTIMINDVQIDITETEFYELKYPEGLQSVITSPGVITECGYDVKIYDYNVNADVFNIIIPAGEVVNGKDILNNWENNNGEDMDKQFYYDISVNIMSPAHSVILTVRNDPDYPQYSNDKFICECLNNTLRIWVKECPVTSLEATITYRLSTKDVYENAYKQYTDLLFYRNEDDDRYINSDGDFNQEYLGALQEAYNILYPEQGVSLYEAYLQSLDEALKQEEVNSGNADIE